jgi:predicted lipoprotein with Yx(FWY)xxD motif
MTHRHRLAAVLLAGTLVLAACGDDSSSDDEAAGTTTAATEPTAAPGDAEPDYGGAGAPASTSVPAAGATVSVAEVGDLGPVLVGPDGRTLYLFEMDSGTSSACLDACAEAWPALAVDGEVAAGEGVDAALLSTADGQVPGQVTYAGHRLYYFASDTAPGDANGVGIPSWYPVDAAGEAVGEA